MAVSTETDVALQMEIFLKVPRISPSEYLPSLQPQLSSQRLIVANFSLVSILVLTYRDHTVQYYISLQVSTPASPASAMLHGISVLVS